MGLAEGVYCFPHKGQLAALLGSVHGVSASLGHGVCTVGQLSCLWLPWGGPGEAGIILSGKVSYESCCVSVTR